MTLARLIAGFVRRHWRAYAISALMLTAIAVLTVSIPRRVGHLVDGLATHSLGQSALLQQLGLLAATGVAIYLLRVGWRQLLFAAAFQLGVELRQRFYQRLAQQGPGFFQRQRTGDLMALATNDIDAIEGAAGDALLAGFDGTQTLLMVLGAMLFGVDWRLALVALLPFPFMAWAFARISRRIHDASREALQRFAQLNDHVQQSVSGVRTLRALGLEPRSSGQFQQLAGAAAAASAKAQRWEAAFEPAVGLTLAASSALTLAAGSYLVLQGELTVGQLTSFGMYLAQLIWPMWAAGWVLALIERGKAAWARLLPVLEAPLAIGDDGRHDVAPSGTIRLQAACARYGAEQAPALQDIDLQIAPGQTIGVVGPTGCGKSTLVRLLLRQLEPSAGSVAWGATALHDYPLARLRAAMAWVPQESFLFSAPIAENIALGRPDASQAQIEAAARMAAIHEDILRFPHGYQTEVGERGITLSGGQRQRVAIARALLAECPLLLLDDALSAVDTGTETRILRHLAELRARQPERAVLITSHRLSAVADADEILVLKDGRVTERGTHAELLALQGWYASQWRYQQLEASLDAA
ncbi:ABC transporter transmembrane domain-containing protein [Massilia sp. TS11]|uniref:ABC transporter transmembrane domain-containing protein n=1 Tax=Massilia sp. TS11 TaxID=2908003 RepID=UPI001EDA5C96|nr:ABC transporter transmembrane domain-containing protein [Massilia sp. TS11]MCG2583709.1 ATP-binding cassette domain-containing protein [Massilia sp. TS11]